MLFIYAQMEKNVVYKRSFCEQKYIGDWGPAHLDTSLRPWWRHICVARIGPGCERNCAGMTPSGGRGGRRRSAVRPPDVASCMLADHRRCLGLCRVLELLELQDLNESRSFVFELRYSKI